MKLSFLETGMPVSSKIVFLIDLKPMILTSKASDCVAGAGSGPGSSWPGLCSCEAVSLTAPPPPAVTWGPQLVPAGCQLRRRPVLAVCKPCLVLCEFGSQGDGVGGSQRRPRLIKNRS